MRNVCLHRLLISMAIIVTATSVLLSKTGKTSLGGLSIALADNLHPQCCTRFPFPVKLIRWAPAPTVTRSHRTIAELTT